MNHAEQIRLMIMDVVANDYEDCDTIAAEVNSWAEEQGLNVTESDLLKLLCDLVRTGHIDAYELPATSQSPRVLAPEEKCAHAYYLISKAGRRLIETRFGNGILGDGIRD